MGDIILQLQFTERQPRQIRRRGIRKLRGKFLERFLGVGKPAQRDGQFRDFQDRLPCPFPRRAERENILISGNGLRLLPDLLQHARAQRHAFSAQCVVFFEPRDLNQIGRGRQRGVRVARRQPDLIKPVCPLPVQFRQKRRRIQQSQNRRRAGKIVLCEFGPRQQQLSARNQFIPRSICAAR